MAANFSNTKCIAFDLDFTILNSDKEMSDRMRQALLAAAKKGIALVPVSGRAFTTIPEEILSMEGVSYVVSSNGSAIYETKTRARIHENLLQARDVRRIMRSVGNFFLEGQITYEAFVNGVAYASADYVRNPAAFGIYPGGVAYIKQSRKPERFIIDFIFDHAKELESLDFILKNEGLFGMIESTVKRNAEQISVTSSVPFRMEILSSEAGKGNGLSYVLHQLGISPEETIAFGDGDNDADMLSLAGIGVALQNATKKCKDAAAYITEASVDEDGVAAFLEEHLL